MKDDSLVADDEYVVFLAKDNAFAAVLPLYVAKCREFGSDAAQTVAAQKMLDNVREWRAAHPDRLKNPDAAREKMLP